ncbi:MAG: FMN-binding protein [Thermodesulfobacteriota bacterium]|nr:MAG: FMN-binding protein [Thermodesulfobacteriota bacterium]
MRKMHRSFYPFIMATVVLTAFMALILLTVPSDAKVFSTKDDALKRAFPDAVMIERKTLFLSKEDVRRIEGLSGRRVDSRLFTYYEAVGPDGTSGYAVIQGHVVRTKSMVYMAVISPAGEIDHIDILAFHEPEEYMPSRRWLDQFRGRRLSERLRINSEIQAITGASLSSYAITGEARKALAILELKVLGAAE